MMAKKWLASALAVLLAAGLAGCAGGDSSSGGATVTLEVVTMFGAGDPHETPYLELNREWQDKTGNKVNDSSAKSSDRWKEHVLNTFNTGAAPDVLFFFGGPTAAPMMKYAVDIDTIRGVDPDYGKNIGSEYIQALTGTNEEGKPVLLPIKLAVEGLFCNKTLFDEAGVPLPTDWDSLLAAIRRFQSAPVGDNESIIPVSVSLSEAAYYYFDHLIMAVGGKAAMEANPKTAGEIPDSWVKGLELLKELNDAGAFVPEAFTMGGEQSESDFLTGKAAMYLDGSWFSIPGDDSGQPVTAKDVSVVPFPSYKDSANEAGTVLVGAPSGWYITKKCWEDEAKREAAIGYIRHQTGDDSILRYIKAAGGFSASPTAVVAPADMTSVQKQFADLLKNAPSAPTVIQDNLTQSAFQVYLSNAVNLAKGEGPGQNPRQLLEQLVAENNK